MRLGVCYYPEQWPDDRWAGDAALMARTGLELVRVGEFAWARYEPARDRWDWGWLDRVLGTLAAAGLRVVLGTPTATPPVWLVRERPDVLAVGPDGRRRAYGTRRHTCPTSAAYRDESARIVRALVDRYGTSEAVVAWQVDNEPGNHDSARCWCEECQAAFCAWLMARYGTVDALNAAWGTAFWSQTYPDFAAVRLPVPTMTGHSPSLLLAHRRFSSAQACAALAEQRAIIAQGSPGRDAATNLYLGDLHIDARAVAEPTGLAAFDSYPHDTTGPDEVAYVHDLARGLAGRHGRAWVMEQQPGPINWTPDKPTVPPGQVRAWAWQAALHGIEALLFFRWRAARHGQEQYHAALLDHDGTPTRALSEVAALASELVAAPVGLLGRPVATIALLHSYDDAWALEIDPHHRGLTHRALLLAAHTAARRLGHEVDVLDPLADLRGYGLVLAPALQLVTPERLAALRAAMAAGATVVLGCRSLVKDAEDCWVDEALPAGLAGDLGARVTEALSNAWWPPDAAPADLTVDPYGCPAGPWAEVLAADGAEVLARYGPGTYLEGAPAAVRRDRLVYAGFSSVEGWMGLLDALGARTGLAAPTRVERFGRDRTIVELDHGTLELRVAGR